MIRLRGRKKVMTCMECFREKAWPNAFVNSSYAECLTCWLRSHPEKVEHFRAALAELGEAPDTANSKEGL